MRSRRPYGFVSLKELRAEPEKIAKRVRAGEVVIVLKRATPLFRLIKVYETEERFLKAEREDVA